MICGTVRCICGARIGQFLDKNKTNYLELFGRIASVIALESWPQFLHFWSPTSDSLSQLTMTVGNKRLLVTAGFANSLKNKQKTPQFPSEWSHNFLQQMKTSRQSSDCFHLTLSQEHSAPTPSPPTISISCVWQISKLIGSKCPLILNCTWSPLDDHTLS